MVPRKYEASIVRQCNPLYTYLLINSKLSSTKEAVYLRRSRFDIIANILTIAKEETLKTPILYGANLNYGQLCNYLVFLLENNLLNSHGCDEQKRYETTEKGFRFLEEYMEIQNILNINEMSKALPL